MFDMLSKSGVVFYGTGRVGRPSDAQMHYDGLASCADSRLTQDRRQRCSEYWIGMSKDGWRSVRQAPAIAPQASLTIDERPSHTGEQQEGAPL